MIIKIFLRFFLFFFIILISCETEPSKGTVTDIDGNVYETIEIGEQEWMAENLRVTKYRNGETIENITSNEDWSVLATGAYCGYDNDESNIETYGLLYNWYAVNDNNNIAPEGWHVPTDDDWKQLEIYLGMSQEEVDQTGYRGTDVGYMMQSTSGWNYNRNGNNSSGFTALPGGCRYKNGNFIELGNYAYFWSSSPAYGDFAWYRELRYGYSTVRYWSEYRQNGFSIRCIKDN